MPLELYAVLPTCVPGICLHKFQVGSGECKVGPSISGFLSVDHSKKTPKDTHKILSDNLGTSGDLFKWTIHSIGNTSYITMLPKKNDGDESDLLLDATFLKVAFSGEDELKNDMCHTNSSLEFINDPKDTDRAELLGVSSDIALKNYSVAVLTRKEPKPDFYDRMTSVACDDDDEKDIIIKSDKTIYERIISRKKNSISKIPFHLLMTGIYSYMIDREVNLICHSTVVDINISTDFPEFNMIDNVDTVIKKLKGSQDARHPKGKEEFIRNGEYEPTILEVIDQKYLISTYLGWSKHNDSD